MKLTNTNNMKRKAGMTLLELTVVILVLLSLISILFIGARAWKKGSDRAGCILNIRNVQQAMRSHANLKNIDIGGTVASTDLIGTGLYLETTPMCPGDRTKAYTYLAAVPAVGTLYAACGNSAVSDHIPAAYADW